MRIARIHLENPHAQKERDILKRPHESLRASLVTVDELDTDTIADQDNVYPIWHGADQTLRKAEAANLVTLR